MKRLLAILVIVSTSFVPLSGQVARPHCAECEAKFDKNSISVAVAHHALRTMYSMSLKIQNGTVSTGDVDFTIMASKLLFAHLEEKGVNAALDSALHNRKQAILDYVPSQEDARKIQANLKTLGVHVSEDRIMNRFFTPRADKEAMVNMMLEGQGVKGMEVQFMKRLENIRAQVSAQESQRNPLLKAKAVKPVQFSDQCNIWVGPPSEGSFGGFGINPHRSLEDLKYRPIQFDGRGCLDTGRRGDPVDPHRCRNYTITAAIFGVCCALGGVPCCIVAAVAELFAALCEAGLPV